MKTLLCILATSMASLSLPATAADKPAAKTASEAPATKRFRNIEVAEWETLRNDAKRVVLNFFCTNSSMLTGLINALNNAGLSVIKPCPKR